MFNATKEELISFESNLIDLYHAGEIPSVMHFCGGNEDQLIEIFKDIQPGDYIFSTHRTHYHYLLAGGTQEDLLDRIRKGDSMYVYNKDLNFLCSCILAGCAGIAAGAAWAIKEKKEDKKVWCFIGDGAEDEGHFYEAVMFVQGHNLPCTFILEDNNRSVDSSKKQRRGQENVIDWPSCVKKYSYEPNLPHCGSPTGAWLKFTEDSVGYYKENKH